MEIPKYGIEIDFIDNSQPLIDGKRPQSPVAKMSDGFMTDSIETMAAHCEDTAKKLRNYARENGLK